MPDGRTLMRIRDLHKELVGLLAEPAPLLGEVERQRELLVELHKLGSRVDAKQVELEMRMIRRHSPDERLKEPGLFNRIRTQEDFDRAQREAVEADSDPGA